MSKGRKRGFIMEKVLQYINRNRSKFLEELKEFLRIPSISNNSDNKKDVLRCAHYVTDQLRRIGRRDTGRSTPPVYSTGLVGHKDDGRAGRVLTVRPRGRRDLPWPSCVLPVFVHQMAFGIRHVWRIPATIERLSGRPTALVNEIRV